MKKVLFITLHDPSVRSGGGLATCSYIEAFSILSKGKLDICLADNCRIDEKRFHCENIFRIPQRSRLFQLLSVFTGEMHRYTEYVKKHLSKYSEQYSHCVFDMSYVGGTLVDYVNSLGNKTITIHHNYQPEYFWDNRKSYFRDRILLYHVKRIEKKAYLKSNYNLFLTENDLSRFEKVYGNNNAKNSLIGTFELMDDKKIILQMDNGFSADKLKIVISGSLSSVQTIDALDYFFDELYSKIPDDYEIIIAGRNPIKRHIDIISKLDNIKLFPNPKDIIDIVSKGDIYLCPTRIGGGMKLRIMDGLKSGLPVLAHAVSARGYEIFEGEKFFYAFDSSDSFMDSLKEIAELIQKNAISKSFIQDCYYSHFSFDSGVERISRAIKEFQ